MPKGGARVGAGRKPGNTAQLRSLQRLHKEIQGDLSELRGLVKTALAESIAKVGHQLPRIVQHRVDAALSGDDKAQEFLINWFSRFLPTEIHISEDRTPIQEFAETLHKLQLAERDANAIEGEFTTIGEVVDDSQRPTNPA